MQATPPPEIVEDVERLFCRRDSKYGPYRRPADSAGEVVVPGAVFRFTLTDPDSQRVTLQVYKGIDTIGGALWTREVRALLRVSAKQHPALPSILGGAYVESDNLAFVITGAARYRLSEPGAMSFIARSPEQALRQFTLLAHGLSLLHEQGITHRNLHPDSIEYVEFGEDQETGDVRFGLRLSRFEMSAMVSNLVRRQLAGENLVTGDLRRLYLGTASTTLAYCPPERAVWLLEQGDSTGALESDRSDIYALGVMAWRWLVEGQSKEERSSEKDRVAWSGLERSVDSVRRLNAHLVSRLRDPGLPRTLADLLRSMLAWDPRDRPSVFSVVQELTQDYGRLVSSLAQVVEPKTHFVAFMPLESSKTIYRWGWIDQDPTTGPGREVLRAFLEDDLRGAEVVYCPEGFSAYQRAQSRDERAAFEAAKYVLIGKQACWFCDVYFEPGPAFGRAERRVEELLLIKYVQHQRDAWRLGDTPLRRRIPGELRFVPVGLDRALDVSEIRAEGATWRPLLRSVEFERSTPPWMNAIDRALSFLLDFRNAEIDARMFPFEVVRASGTSAELRVDVPRDRRRQYEDALRSLYFREVRIPLGRLLEGLDREHTVPLAVYADQSGRPNFRGGIQAKVVFDQRLDDDNVRVRLTGRMQALPELGWIRPDDDRSAYSQLLRQEDAVNELLHARSLLHQLHSPTAIKGIRARWRGTGDHLRGRSPEIVKDILSSEPFYALHGPPGTGKTTVTAVAVAAHLRADASQRILVSSQSHYALDNLALQVVKSCKTEGLDVVAVRVASSHAISEEKVHPRVEPFLPDRLASTVVARVVRTCRQAIDSGRLADGRALDPTLKELLAEWMQQVPRVELEIRDRIRRGANLIFATTGGSTERNVSTGGAGSLFDWVIVEEAARGWPTEIALPLVRGLRWTLVGDHFQLPAFDELSVQRFLDLCEKNPDEELRAHGQRRAEYLEVFRLFGTLFDNRAKRREGHPSSNRLTEPLDELDLQFRMHADICRVVSRAFYRQRIDPESGRLVTYDEGWLRTDASAATRAHALVEPAFLRGRAVVWLDTDGVDDTNDQQAWKNVGEARVVKALLDRFSPTPAADSADQDDDKFALLTPYTAQVEELERVGLPAWARSRLQTVDSFQGREADIVVVSLVRATQRDDKRPESNIGYLVSPNRVNVLLSRAKSLLVIIGRLAHFERQCILNPEREDIRFWSDIVDEVRRQRAVVRAKDALGSYL
ncbi:MAG: hypothetical protein JNL90_10765 [Planctomycetes bacterium]|nr:hypothetical protein [Planctomycetota bacterium]